MDDRRISVVVAGLATFAIYHKFDPQRPVAHLVLLVVVPACLIAYTPHDRAFNTLSAYLSYWALILLCVLGYRLSPFHPLAKYPGPTAAKLSKIWMTNHAVRGNTHTVVRTQHTYYGDIVRIGPNELSFARPDAIKPILMDRALEKGPYYDTRSMPTGHALDGMRDFAEHARRRKPWTRAMSTAALKGYHPILREKIGELLECLEARAQREEVVNLADWMSFFGFDFMGKMAFNHDFGMIKAGRDVEGFWRLIDGGVIAAAWVSHIPWIFPLLKLIPGGNKGMDSLQAFTVTTAKKRVQSGSQNEDLFHYLAGDDLPPDSDQKPTLDDAASDGALSIIGGSDTAATALSHICYFMLRYPQYHKRLRDEIEKNFPQGEDTFDTTLHANMPYLNACINEVLRLYPPVLSPVQHRVELGAGGYMIADHFIPEGTQVSVHTYTLHRHPSFFSPLPDTFWPDRWLAQDRYIMPTGEEIAPEQVVTDRAAFVPFSAGQQVCAGRSLAMMEMRAVVCALMRGFDMAAAEGFRVESWEENVKDVFLTTLGPLLVTLKMRE